MLAGMRIGISGKGGTGKTTVAAGLARGLARRGRSVVAIDCDSDPNLALGLGCGQFERDRRLPPAGTPMAHLVGEYGLRAADDVTVLLAAQAERAGSG
ncbi:MAG: hypothetical protein BRC32_01955 [Actinobacteria bacterium QS_8_72_14]|nr:MAG: hypothetical protein BRC32_01955 [Actinobacteria bacterium QS_8_72_14]